MITKATHLYCAAICLLVVVLVMASPVAAMDVPLEWEASPSEVTGYRVYMKVGNEVSHYDAGNATAYIITDAPDDKSALYTVTAYDVHGNESSETNTVKTNGFPEFTDPTEIMPAGELKFKEGEP